MKNFIECIELRTFSTGSLTTNYQPLDTEGLEEACFQIILNNNSSNIIDISFDGETDHARLSANQVLPMPQGFSSLVLNNTAIWQKGTIVYIKSTTNTSGTIALSGFYL